MYSRVTFAAALGLCLLLELPIAAQSRLEFGFAKRDITPDIPLRLSGYGSRSDVFEGVDERLFARAMVIRSAGDAIAVLVSVDTIGFPGVLTKSIAARVRERHDVARDRFVICCTHAHTAPHIADGLTNILAVPLTAEQARNSRQYTGRVADLVVAAVDEAVESLQPGRLFVGQGTVGFAKNRRVLRDGHWTFGVNTDGATDHSLPVLKVTDAAGEVRGVLFNYACHCTTFGPDYNRVHGDWAGHATRIVEERYPGATALCAIGCGADQNPGRDNDPAVAMTLARSQGTELADEIAQILQTDMREITESVSTSFGYAGLPVDRPSLDELKAALNDRRVQVRRHAQSMLDLHERMGRLPETYPAPVQVWRFGDQLCMVFLGGEVVVDYALRLKKEIDSQLVWISAYSNDVFGYVASERVRQEGGYEVSGSMIYYNQPGPWAKGTEEVLVRRVKELAEQGSFAGPVSAEEAVPRFHVAAGMAVGVVAAEPLIEDPVNFAVGADGRLWVVEMGDYPRGVDDQGGAGGRVKVLDDLDGDGRFDQATVFLEGLEFPTGVFPWRKGVLISQAPDILYAEDSDGDGQADIRKSLYRGFEEDNPQHRVAGFAYGLDHWLYLSSGTNNHTIESLVTGETIDMSGRDARIQPDQGRIAATSGRTQFGRARDDWGNWFGGNNSRPIWHFVISDHYLGRNPYFPVPEPLVDLLVPPLAPPVYPTSRTLDRFNDLFALNRFTSACSPTIFRDATLGPDAEGAAFVAEPVHNLVHRAMLDDVGVTFAGKRHPQEERSEFLSSTDHWFRPTTISTGPDGALWIADMYRYVIEHPEWIPESWQAQLDLRAGHDRGRIYRVYSQESGFESIPNLAHMSSKRLVQQLTHRNGWRRDTAQRLLIERNDHAVAGPLAELLRKPNMPLAKVHALGALQGLGALDVDHLALALEDADPRVQRRAVLLSEPFLNRFPSLGRRLGELAAHSDKRLRLQVAFSLGEWEDSSAADYLSQMAVANVDDMWIRTAVLSSSYKHAHQILKTVLGSASSSRDHSVLLQHLIATAIRADAERGIEEVLASLTALEGPEAELWRIEALASFDRAVRSQDTSLTELRRDARGELAQSLDRAAQIVDAARRLAKDETAPVEHRLVALPLLGRGFDQTQQDRQTLAGFLSPRHPLSLQIAAVQALAQLDRPDIPSLLLEHWRQLSPRIQSEVLTVLLTKRGWHESLLKAIESRQVAPSDLDATTRNRLLSLPNRAMRERVRKQLGTAQNEDRQQVIQQYASAARLEGDPVRGAAAFQKVCAACHRHNGIGTEIGANLSALQDKSGEALLVAVLDPNRAVEGKYKNYNCITVDGRVLSGMIVAETSTSITLAQANGTQAVLLRVDIEELTSSGISFMPDGLEKDFDPQSLADVFAFLRSDQDQVKVTD